MAEKEPVRKPGVQEPERAKGTSQEDLLKEQQLSTERQREGRGWHELEPGESRGTTPPSTTPTEPTQTGHPEGGTPGADRAEHQGERPAGQKKPEEETTGGARGQRGERRGT